FAGVGVAHQCHLTMTTPGSTLTLDPASAVDLFQFTLDVVNALHQTTAIYFQLGLTGSAGANATRLLGKRTVGSTQTRKPVLQQGQLDLRLALGRAGVLGEDVQNHGRAVDGGSAQNLF